eukprot:1583587-Pyramimonas_sp.AAC.1
MILRGTVGTFAPRSPARGRPCGHFSIAFVVPCSYRVAVGGGRPGGVWLRGHAQADRHPR